MRYDWIYLCSNPKRLELTLRLLPRTPFVDLDRMIVGYCSHLDGDVWRMLEMTASQWKPNWLNLEVHDLSGLGAHLPDELVQYWHNSKSRWSLGVKLVLPYAVCGPYLYTDDDVIVSRDPHDWLMYSFGSKGCFRFAGKKQGIAAQLFDAFGLRYEPAWRHYDDNALDAGVWFQKYHDNWDERLADFAKLPYLLDLTTNNLELRCLDQRFLTCFGIEHGWDRRTIGNGFAPCEVSERMLNRHPFFHYKSSSKEEWMRRLSDYVQTAR